MKVRYDVYIAPNGDKHCIYSDEINQLLNHPKREIHRAAYIEPNVDGEWILDLSPIDGGYNPVGPLHSYRDALEVEKRLVSTHLFPFLRAQANALIGA